MLFGGIIVGHFAGASDLALDAQTLHFIQEFGLILFVYTIGIQVGPGFFSSLRSSGLKLNAFAALLVSLGCVVAAGLHQFFDVPLPVILGSSPVPSPIRHLSVRASKSWPSWAPRPVLPA